MCLKFKTAGESHGPALITIIDGLPAGLKIDPQIINRDLTRRQSGYGRGGRMKIEKDKVEILAGVRDGETIGSPVAFMIKNKDYRVEKEAPLTRARPGHADLAGAMKYGFSDMRHVLERASARETAAHCAAGTVAKILLGIFSIEVLSLVRAIGGIEADIEGIPSSNAQALAEASPVRCPDEKATDKMIAAIQAASDQGDSLGGIFEVRVLNVPPGLGSYTAWDRKLDARLARALMAINGIKGVEIGLGFSCAALLGSACHDPIEPRERSPDKKSRYHRTTNHAGGCEGGMTNGEELVVKAAMKPIATLRRPLPSVDIATGKAIQAQYERSDTCAVPAAAIVGEASVAFVIAQALLEKFGGDHIADTLMAYEAYMTRLVRQF